MIEAPPEDRVLARYREVVSAAGGEENHILTKSSLYKRLLDGKRPLALPPPLNHSYPWYRVVESDTPISLPFGPAEWCPDWDTRHGIAINQDVWTKLHGDLASNLTITYQGWDKLGFIWRVWLADEPAEISDAFLCCWHREDVRRLDTPELVEAECRWRVERTARWVAESGKLNDDELKVAYIRSGQAGKMGDKFDEILADQHLAKCRAIAAERSAVGMPLDYSQQEIELKVTESVVGLMGNSWFAKGGKLFHRTWKIQRVSPSALGSQHYLEPV